MKKVIILGLIILLIGVGSLMIEFRAEEGINVTNIQIETNGRILAGVEATPKGSHELNSLPAVAVFHGFTASKEMMRPFIEGLARVGFFVIAIDQQGHGQSTGDLREDGENSLRNDGVSVIDYIRSQNIVDPLRVGILGHSMGAGTAIATSTFIGNLASTVLLGNSLSGIDEFNVSPTFPENVFMGIGKYDELFTVQEAVDSFTELIDTDPEVNTLYGNFELGTARELLVTATDHILEVINPGLVERSIEWLYQSLVDSSVTLDNEALTSVNGWSYILDQFLSVVVGLLILSIIPVVFWMLPQNHEIDEEPIPWISQGLIAFSSFMLAIPIFIIVGGGFVPLFAAWFIAGGLIYALVISRRSEERTIMETFSSTLKWKTDLAFAMIVFFTILLLTNLILLLVHWDYRYVLPLLGALNLRRFGLFLLIFIPAVFFFRFELEALRGYEEVSIKQFLREVAARIWLFTFLLFLHYFPIIAFQTPILPSIFGFLAFFIVGLLPVMVILSVISSIGRKYQWSYLAMAILSSGLISWMLASTLSFNA